jgi:NadR type nicotinamide-nucleotide adenylyltransferase
MKQGLVIGKFYPFHKGHTYLIETALRMSDRLTILVCEHIDQTIPGSVRVEWIQRTFPQADVRVIPDLVADDDSLGWAKYTVSFLGFIPDVVFTSEIYGDAYTRYMGSRHVCVDRERQNVPISGTAIRERFWENAEYMDSYVWAYFLRRVAVVGAESTGTTTLARDLAKHFHTQWVPEVGRQYSEGKFFSSKKDIWNMRELEQIGRAQIRLEESFAQISERLLIADTNVLATQLWCERLVGKKSAVLKELSERQRYDLILLTDIQTPFHQDGMREGGVAREAMHQRFLEVLRQEERLPFEIVSGSRKQRLEKSVKKIQDFLEREYVWTGGHTVWGN